MYVLTVWVGRGCLKVRMSIIVGSGVTTWEYLSVPHDAGAEGSIILLRIFFKSRDLMMDILLWGGWG